MSFIEKAEQLPKLYGLGREEQGVVGKVNDAIRSILNGIPEKRQMEIMDMLSEGRLSLELQ